MKNVFVIIFSLILLLGCQSTKKPEYLLGPVSMEHTAIMGISAHYYCVYNKWPESIVNIKRFDEKQRSISHIKINWIRLQNISKYIYKPSYQFTSIIKQENREVVKVTSGQEVPICEGKNIIMQGNYVNL